MINNMKKIIITVLSLAILLAGVRVFASTEWNGASNDCNSIAIANADTNQGWTYPCWTGTNISADDGEDVNVRIYYHNTGTSTSTNTRLYLYHNGGTSSQHSFSGKIVGSQGTISFGPVYVNLSSSQALTYDSVRWYTNNTSQTLTSLLSGQDGEEILNGGLNIGSITPGWSSQGTVVVNFKVGNSNNGGGGIDYNNCSISKFKIDGGSHAYIDEGDNVDLDWDTVNCNSVYVSGPNYSSNSHDGSVTVYPNYSGTYTITAYGNNGTKTKSVYVTLDNNNNNNRCTISYFNASPTTINSGSATTLTWSMSNCNSASISGLGSVNSYGYGSRIVYPGYTTKYILNAYGNNGSDSDSVQVNVNNYVEPVQVNCAVTTAATNILANSATLNGFVTSASNAYFQYGTDVNMGLQTSPRSISNGYFNENIFGLSRATIYYYRLVANCQGGISKGAIQVFETDGGSGDVAPINTTTTRTIIRQGTTVYGVASPIMLKIENRYQNIKVGDIIDYTVTYKNIGKNTLTHPMVQVIFPKGISFINASRGTFSNSNNTLSVPLDNLRSQDEGVIYVQGRVDSLESLYTQVVTTALLIYTNTNTAQENAMAYVLNNPSNLTGNSGLSANAFFAGFFGMSLLGWLFLILLILIIVLLVRNYYPRNRNHLN